MRKVVERLLRKPESIYIYDIHIYHIYIYIKHITIYVSIAKLVFGGLIFPLFSSPAHPGISPISLHHREPLKATHLFLPGLTLGLTFSKH